MKHRHITLILAVSTALYACGAETGNGLGPSMSMRATQTGSGLTPREPAAPPVLHGRDAQGTALTLTSARVHVRHIELQSPGGKFCNDEDYADSGFVVHCDSSKLRLEGPLVVDLMTGISTPSLENVIIPAGTYKRIDVRLDDAEGGRNDGLDDVTMVASGEISYRMTPTPYDLALEFNEDARFEEPGGVTVSEDADQVLMLLDVTQWFSRLPLTECLDDGDLEIEDGRIRIEDKGSKCGDVEKALKDAIKGSTKLTKG